MAGPNLRLSPSLLIACALASTVSAACSLIDDPAHCANRGGDAACQQLFGAAYQCSVCTRVADGCTAEGITAECRAASPADGSGSNTDASGSGSGSSEAGSSTGMPVPDCEGSGMVAGCPAELPFCVDGNCAGCVDAGGDEACAAASGSTPQCHPNTGACVECYATPSPACGEDAPFCTTEFTCGGCTSHDDCPDSACNLFRGTCMDDAIQVWIDDENCDNGASGSASAPLCTIDAAINRIATGDSGVIHAGAAGFGKLRLESCSVRYVAVLGESSVTTIFNTSEVPGASTINVACGNELMLDNVRVRRNVDSAVECSNGGRIALTRARVDDGLRGVHADDCSIISRRSRYLELRGAALEAVNGAELDLEGDIIAATVSDDDPMTTDGGVVVDGASVAFRFATLVDNVDDNVVCEGAYEVSAHSSIVINEVGGPSFACTDAAVDHSVIDSTLTNGTENSALTFDAGWFLNRPQHDYRLGGAGSALDGIGRWDPGDPRIDIDRDPWPDVPGSASYPGADQP